MKHIAKRTPRFDREWKAMISLIPENRQSAMEQAIRNYQLSGKEPDALAGAEIMAFLLIKKIVDRRAKQRIARRNKKEASCAVAEKSIAQEIEISQDKHSAEPEVKSEAEPEQEARQHSPVIAKKKQAFGPLGNINRLRQESLAKKRILRHDKYLNHKKHVKSKNLR